VLLAAGACRVDGEIMGKLCGIGTRVVRCSLFTVSDADTNGFMCLGKA